MKPHWLRIGGYWYPRGGMPIDVFWQSGAPPEGLWLPDQGVAALSWPRLKPRIAILGAGSVGCFIGGCWQAAGLPVTFIGRPKIAAGHRRARADAQRLSAAGRRISPTSIIAPTRRRWPRRTSSR